MKLLKNLLRSILRPPALALRSFGIVPPASIFQHLHFKGPFVVELPGNFGSIRLMSWGHKLENKLFWLGWTGQEPDERRWWGRIAMEASCVLDIGANTGTYAIMAKAFSKHATVHGFEPISRIAALARKNCVVSGLDVTIYEVAMADQQGELPIYDPGGPNAYSASLASEFLSGHKDKYMVQVTTIDAHCAAHNLDPDLIKIDVEGVEGKVLLGARETLARKRAIVLCEWLGHSESHVQALKLLDEMDYVCVDFRQGKVVSIETSQVHEERNLLLCPKHLVNGLLEKGPLI